MSLLEWAAIATIANFIFFALLTIIDRWPQIFKWGKPYLPKIALIFLIFGVISAGVSLYASWYILPKLTSINQEITPYIQDKKEFSKEEELILKKLIQEYKEPYKEASKKTYVLPPLGEGAVLKTELMPRPRLDPFTEAEFKAIPITAHGKILEYVVNVTAYMDEADAAVEAHEDYERSIFGGKKENK